jgi:hypothetical protein
MAPVAPPWAKQGNAAMAKDKTSDKKRSRRQFIHPPTNIPGHTGNLCDFVRPGHGDGEQQFAQGIHPQD